MTSSHPNKALPALSGETSLCIALPLSSTRASSLPNSSRPSRRTDSRPSRVRSRVPATPERRSRRRPERTGGKGVNRASSNGSRMRCQPVTIRSQASPSPAWCWSRPAAVSAAARRSTAAPAVGQGVGHDVRCVPPGQAVPLEVEVADDRAGRRERVERAEQVGDEARVRRSARCAPHPRPRPGPRRARRPSRASASALAATRPLGPAPTTTASQVVTGIGSPSSNGGGPGGADP